MSEESISITSRLANLDKDIAETKRSLPAHSIQPAVMIDLLALEDERDLLMSRLADLEKANG
jgi:hypothetical protein